MTERIDSLARRCGVPPWAAVLTLILAVDVVLAVALVAAVSNGGPLSPRQWTDAQIKSEFEGKSVADVTKRLGEPLYPYEPKVFTSSYGPVGSSYREAQIAFLDEGPRPGWLIYRLLVVEPKGSCERNVEFCVLNGRVSGVRIRP